MMLKFRRDKRTRNGSWKGASRASWGFFSNITGEEAEKLLLDKGNHGSYLCRRSGSMAGAYTLTVRRNGQVEHFKIYNDGECFELYENDGFASVPDLIEYYLHNPRLFTDKSGNVVELAQPLVPDDDEMLQELEQEKWYFGDISKNDAEILLTKKGEHGSFLIRESRSQPGCFVLSVRRGHAVSEFLVSYTQGKFDIASAKPLGFPSMNQLIEYYQKKPLVDKSSEHTVKLVEPLCDTAERLRSHERIKKEFEWLQQEDRANTSTSYEGLRTENKLKNRYKNILPFDHTRVVLRDADPTIPGSDYINSSYIFDDESGALFIASQGCMKHTVEAFWQMVCQENTRIVIMVTNEVEKGKIKCVRYWPDPGADISFDKRTIVNTGEKQTRDYIVRQLDIFEQGDADRAGKASRRVYHYQYINWPDHGVPKEPGALLEMLQQIEATQQTLEYPGPPVIHCSAGIGRSGTVIVICMLMSLLRIKGHLEERDVPRTVQKVRLQRSGMVQTEAQYHFIYAALVYFMDALEKREMIGRQQHEAYGNLEALAAHLRQMQASDDDGGPHRHPRSAASARSHGTIRYEPNTVLQEQLSCCEAPNGSRIYMSR